MESARKIKRNYTKRTHAEISYRLARLKAALKKKAELIRKLERKLTDTSR